MSGVFYIVIYVCICAYYVIICMYICMHACMYVRMYAYYAVCITLYVCMLQQFHLRIQLLQECSNYTRKSRATMHCRSHLMDYLCRIITYISV